MIFHDWPFHRSVRTRPSRMPTAHSSRGHSTRVQASVRRADRRQAVHVYGHVWESPMPRPLAGATVQPGRKAPMDAIWIFIATVVIACIAIAVRRRQR